MRALLALPFLLLAGCNDTSAEGPGGTMTLNFWNGFSGPDGKMMEQIVRDFNKENPGVRVRMQIVPWATYYDKLTLGLAFGGAPDIFILHAARLPEYASHNALQPMDDLYGPGKLDPKDFAEVALAATLWEGKRYAVPLDCHPWGLYYNAKLFEEAGIVDEQGRAKPPTTYEEFVDAGKKLTKDTNNDGKPEQWGFAFTNFHQSGYTFLNQYGLSILTADLQRSTLGQAGARAAVERMLEIIEKHRIAPPPAGQDAWASFKLGKVAMVMEGVYMMTDLDNQKGLRYGAAPTPVFGERPGVWGGSHLLCSPGKLSGPRREVAARFIRYLSDHSLSWAKGGQVPVRKSILATPEFKALRVQSAFAQQLPYVNLEPPSKSFNLVAPFGDRAFEASMFGLKPVDEALAEGARRIDRILKREER